MVSEGYDAIFQQAANLPIEKIKKQGEKNRKILPANEAESGTFNKEHIDQLLKMINPMPHLVFLVFLWHKQVEILTQSLVETLCGSQTNASELEYDDCTC